MYAGELIEEGPVGTVFGHPAHPYTRGLLDCLPTLGRDKRAAALRSIPGQVGSPLRAHPAAPSPRAAPMPCRSSAPAPIATQDMPTSPSTA